MKSLLTTTELVKYLDVSRPTVYTWIKDKAFPHIRLGRLIRYDQATVDEWMAQQTLKAHAEAAALRIEHQRLVRHNHRPPMAFALD